MMKKLTPIIMLCICLFLSTPISANTDIPPVTGYTAEGIYYEAITIACSSYSTYTTAYSITLTKEITYDGTVIPSDSIPWTEKFNGHTYSGILYLQSYYYWDGTTVTTYKGTIYLQ